MARSTRYSPEVREREVRMVFEHESEYTSQWQARGGKSNVRSCPVIRGGPMAVIMRVLKDPFTGIRAGSYFNMTMRFVWVAPSASRRMK